MASKKSRKTESRSLSARASRRQGQGGRREEAYRPGATEAAERNEALTPLEHYRREKARRAGEGRNAIADPLEEARREYRAMLAADAAKQKGGRPKKTVSRPADAGDEHENALEGEPETDAVADEHEHEHDGEGDGPA